MNDKKEQFATLLTKAIERIKSREGKKINLIQDELGYHVDPPSEAAKGNHGVVQEKGAGSTIEYWRKGHIPPTHEKIERLARELVRRARMERGWLIDFLEAASFGIGSEKLIEELFPSSQQLPMPQLINDPAPFQALALTPHFVGREAEFAQIETLLTAATGPRIVALVGMGGIGKTTLAVGLAHRLRARFKDGVLWGHAATSDPLDILNLWAKAYDCDFSGQSDLQNRAAAVRGLLTDKETLIVLDDVTSIERIRPLLPNSPTSIVLLTTRNEEVAVGLGAQIVRVAELLPNDGVGLLTQILGKERVETEAADALLICQRLHHLPLAVEIAAQFLRARTRRSLHDLATQLEDTQLRLDLAIADRAVRTSFLVSWEVLDEAHRTCFSHIAVFAGRHFTLDALAAVLAWDRTRTQDRLEMLRALSLVKEEGETHYRQHPLLADFASEQLQKAEKASTQAHQQMARYYLDFASKYQTNYALLEPEWDNLMAGMESAYHQQDWALVVQYAETLTDPWFTRAEYTRARKGFSWAVEGAEKLKDLFVQSNLFIEWGRACVEQYDNDEAIIHLQHGLHFANEISNLNLRAKATELLSAISLERGEYENADQQLTDAEEMYQSLFDLLGEARILYERAFLLYRIGNYTASETICQKALQIRESIAIDSNYIAILRLLADCANQHEQYDVVQNYCQQAHDAAIQLGRQNDIAQSALSLATIFRCLNNLEQAQHYAEKAKKMSFSIGNRAFFAFSLYEESIILAKMGKHLDALAICKESLTNLSRLNDEYSQVICLMHLGDVYLKLGDQQQAVSSWQQGVELAKPIKHPMINLLIDRLKSVNHCEYCISIKG